MTGICKFCAKEIIHVTDRRGRSFWRHRRTGAGGCWSIRDRAGRVAIRPANLLDRVRLAARR